METKQGTRHEALAEEQTEIAYDVCSVQLEWTKSEDKSAWSPFVFRYPDIRQIKKFNPRDLTSEEREKIIKAMFEHHHPVYKRLAEI